MLGTRSPRRHPPRDQVGEIIRTIEQHIDLCRTALSFVQRGPWHNEPHYAEFTYLGYRCLILRDIPSSTLRGYVMMPDSHPWRGRTLDMLPLKCHEGPTYSGTGLDLPVAVGGGLIAWWIGIHCCHDSDKEPGIEGYGSYRDWDFVKTELKSIVSQARKVARGRHWGGKRA